jgi:small subunit ribosomal protein S36
VPQLLHIGASINNDNLLVLLGGILAVLLAGVLAGDGRRWSAAAIGLVAGLALLTKAFALAMLPWIGLVYGYQLWRSRGRRKEFGAGLAIAASVAALVGAWWYVRNLARYGKVSPSELDASSETVRAGFHPDPLWFSHHFFTTMGQRFWGDFGNYEATMTKGVVILATAVVVASVVVVFVGRPAGARTDPPVSRAGLAVYASILLMLLALVVSNSYPPYRSSGATSYIQGRYLFGAMVPFAVIVAFGVTRLLGRWSPLAVLAGAAVMQFDAVRVSLRAWWAEPDASVARRFDALLAWIPVDAWVVDGLLAVSALLAVTTVWLLVRTARGTSSTPRGSVASGVPGRRGRHVSAHL